MKIDWVRKLTSRKFWIAVASFVSMLIVAFGASEQSATQISAIIMAGATVLGYILAEGLVDANQTVYVFNDSDEEEEFEEDEDEEPDDVKTISATLAEDTTEEN